MQDKKHETKQAIDYAYAMKKMGIKLSSIPEYKNAEQYGRTLQRTSIQKHAQVAFTASI